MSAIIIDLCSYTQFALKAWCIKYGMPENMIRCASELKSSENKYLENNADLFFINEECFIHDGQATDRLRQIICEHHQALFIFFIDKKIINSHTFIRLKENVIITSKHIKMETIEALYRSFRDRELEPAISHEQVSAMRLSNTEINLLKMWMSGQDTMTICGTLNIKEKTVSSHKCNIRRKIKSHNKQVIFHVVKLANILTQGAYLGNS